MGTTTSITYVTKANVTTPTPVIVSNVPSDILGSAVTNLGYLGGIKDVSPVPGNDHHNDQTIQKHIGKMTRDLFFDEFGYEAEENGKKLPEDIYEATKLLDVKAGFHFFYPDDPKSNKEIITYMTDGRTGLLDHFNKDNLANDKFEDILKESNLIIEEILKDIKKVFYLNYSVWTSDTDNYHGPMKTTRNGKKARAQIDIAYYAYRFKNALEGKDGVYIYIVSAAYLAEFNPY